MRQHEDALRHIPIPWTLVAAFTTGGTKRFNPFTGWLTASQFKRVKFILETISLQTNMSITFCYETANVENTPIAQFSLGSAITTNTTTYGVLTDISASVDLIQSLRASTFDVVAYVEQQLLIGSIDGSFRGIGELIVHGHDIDLTSPADVQLLSDIFDVAANFDVPVVLHLNAGTTETDPWQVNTTVEENWRQLGEALSGRNQRPNTRPLKLVLAHCALGPPDPMFFGTTAWDAYVCRIEDLFRLEDLLNI